MQAEITGYRFWEKNQQAIDLQGLFNDNWDSNDHEFTLPSQLR
jgi:hypothetical protein